MTHQEPCPRCGNRLAVLVDVFENLPYLQCVDCGLGFSDPSALDGASGSVFQDREMPGGVRRANGVDLTNAGWSASDFLRGHDDR